MAQPSSYGPSTNSALSGVVQDHISQSQSTEMLTYNSNNTSNNNNMEAEVETVNGESTYVPNNTSSNQVSSNINQQPTNAGAIHKEGKTGKAAKQQQPRKPPPTIDTFWPTVLHEVQHTAMVDSKHQSLPLARIKKIMKLDENAKMIAAEAPLLFAKACEFFIQELTMRAWIHTDESKRRTLQRSDIAQAIANYDQFDFLIDIVPREDIKPPSHRRSHQNDTSTTFNNATGTNNPAITTPVSNVVTGEILNVSTVPLDNMAGSVSVNTVQPSAATIAGAVSQQQQPTQVITTNQPTQQLQIIQQAAHPQQQLQYFITLPGQQNSQTQLVHQLQLQQQQQQQHLNNGMGTPLTAASLNLVAQQPHQLILTAANPTGAQAANVVQQQQQAALLQNLAQQHHQQQQQQQQQQVQFLQHVVLTPNGELANMPIAINANQLQLLRLQMQQQQQQQQQQQHHIIPTHLLTAQQILQLQAAQQNNNTTTTHIVHHQPQQQPQQHSQSQTSTNNIYINSNPATASQASSASMVSTDRNLGSTFRNNC